MGNCAWNSGCSCRMGGGQAKFRQILDKCQGFVQHLFKLCPSFVFVQYLSISSLFYWVLSKICQDPVQKFCHLSKNCQKKMSLSNDFSDGQTLDNKMSSFCPSIGVK